MRVRTQEPAVGLGPLRATAMVPFASGLSEWPGEGKEALLGARWGGSWIGGKGFRVDTG